MIAGQRLKPKSYSLVPPPRRPAPQDFLPPVKHVPVEQQAADAIARAAFEQKYIPSSSGKRRTPKKMESQQQSSQQMHHNLNHETQQEQQVGLEDEDGEHELDDGSQNITMSQMLNSTNVMDPSWKDRSPFQVLDERQGISTRDHEQQNM